VLTDATEAVRLLPGVVTDVDTTTYRGDACVTPESAQDALYAWRNQLPAMPPEPADGEARLKWRWARDHGQKAVCKHDKRRPVPMLDLETGESTIVR
jgi:hypothetical protein